MLEDIVYAQMYWQWEGSKFHPLLSARHLIGAHFLTTENDKRIRLLTRLYGMHVYTYIGEQIDIALLSPHIVDNCGFD